MPIRPLPVPVTAKNQATETPQDQLRQAFNRLFKNQVGNLNWNGYTLYSKGFVNGFWGGITTTVDAAKLALSAAEDLYGFAVFPHAILRTGSLAGTTVSTRRSTSSGTTTSSKKSPVCAAFRTECAEGLRVRIAVHGQPGSWRFVE